MKKANKMKLTVCAAVSVGACLLFGAGCKKRYALKRLYLFKLRAIIRGFSFQRNHGNKASFSQLSIP